MALGGGFKLPPYFYFEIIYIIMYERSSRGYTYFVWLNPSKASYGFTGYTDKDGEHKYIQRGVDERGSVIYRRFKFNPNKRIMSIPNSQKDVIIFLQEHPECKDSTNGYYRTDKDGKLIQLGVTFKEMNTGKDAGIAIDAISDKVEATSTALQYKKVIKDSTDPEVFSITVKDDEGNDVVKIDEIKKGENTAKLKELEELAVLCGTFVEDSQLQLHTILQYSENNPQRFLDIYNDPSRKARFLINKGIHGSNKFIEKRDFMFYFRDKHIGNDISEAVQSLLKDDKLLAAVEEAMIRT